MSSSNKKLEVDTSTLRAMASIARSSMTKSNNLEDEETFSRPVSPPFSELEQYKELKKIRAASDMFGIKSPFFKLHDQRAGATTSIAGKPLNNFSSYDYVGLNGDARVAEAAKSAIDKYGTSASASRLVAGERPVHRELEQVLARHYGVESALVFVSGHATNVTTISQLMNERDLVVFDSYAHNSVMVGAQLSGAEIRAFNHNDLQALTKILRENRGRYRHALIVVEGLYSMDGDTSDLAELIQIKDEFGAWLMVDEAHAMGVLGKTGRGSLELCGIDPTHVDIWMGTLSKSLGATGGYICGSRSLIEILKARAPGFVFSVGLSPPLASAANCALNILHDEPERVMRLQSNGKKFLALAEKCGLDTGYSEGYAVVPVMIGDSLKAAKLSNRLFQVGINVMPIVYPAVPMNAARLRFFITSEHTDEQIKSAVEATRQELDMLPDNVYE